MAPLVCILVTPPGSDQPQGPTVPGAAHTAWNTGPAPKSSQAKRRTDGCKQGNLARVLNLSVTASVPHSLFPREITLTSQTRRPRCQGHRTRLRTPKSQATPPSGPPARTPSGRKTHVRTGSDAPSTPLTSMWPLCTAWCSAVRPVRSATLTLLSRGMMASAHLVALLAAAMWSGVCQYLSRALTSAECFRRRLSAFCQDRERVAVPHAGGGRQSLGS